ncbi:MAG: glycoside hydrolase family 2 TIM barrel-domain containing protein [Mangrovibacterium sp.]
MKNLILFALLLIGISALGQATKVYPAYDNGYTQTLNGTWTFKYIPSLEIGADLNFYKRDADIASWDKIKVPSNWEMQGFGEPKYGLRLDDGLGLYRREFSVPQSWKEGRHVYLRFEGVAYGFELWVNGKQVGGSTASAYNPHTFDITAFLSEDSCNDIAVKVTTKPDAFKWDLNDAWSLSGIFRDVTLFSLPEVHLQQVVARTQVDAKNNASVTVNAIANNSDMSIKGELYAPDNSLVKEFSLPFNADSNYFAANFEVEKPQLWTAETPALYTLNLRTSLNGKELQVITEKIGLREVTVDGYVLKLNGRSIKLRGVAHHDLDPITGRALTKEQMRKEVLLLKEGNVNYIRTSHYPPNEYLIELCDELGIYVMDEVPLSSRGGAYLDDPNYEQNIYNRVEATVGRDINHPSVISWSIGNENEMNGGEIKAIQKMKTIDPTRPVVLPKTAGKFGSNYTKYPACVDLFSGHYPRTSMLEAWATRVTRPTVFTEYAHAQGLSVERIHSQWEIIQATPRFAGGAIWHFFDQGILRESDTPVDKNEFTVYAWEDATHYYDTGEKLTTDTKGIDGADGLVYANRVPQTDFLEMRKVYSPVQVRTDSVEVKEGKQAIKVALENRFDFRSLEGINMEWELHQNREVIQRGSLPLSVESHGTEELNISVDMPAYNANDVLFIALKVIEDNGFEYTEASMHLNYAEAFSSQLIGLESLGSMKLKKGKEQVVLNLGDYSVVVDQRTGELSITDEEGESLLAGIYPHVGRKMRMTERRNGKSHFGFWNKPILEDTQDVIVSVEKGKSEIKLRVEAKYPREKGSDEVLEGFYELTIHPTGEIGVDYSYKPTNTTGAFAEAGLSLVVPDVYSELRWIGDGPYPAFPGSDRLGEFGIYHLNKEDLYFQGNHRNVEVSMLTKPSGSGIALLNHNDTDVAIEKDGKEQLVWSQNVLISSIGNKLGGGTETKVNADAYPTIAGGFIIVLLDDKWAGQLVKWFEKPAAAQNVFAPFYHSYDQ